MKILHLTLMKKWFDLIALGEKGHEYREIKPYWTKRFFDARERTIQYDEIHFRNGYAKDAPWMRVKWEGVELTRWNDIDVFAIKLGERLEIRNWPKVDAPAHMKEGER